MKSLSLTLLLLLNFSSFAKIDISGNSKTSREAILKLARLHKMSAPYSKEDTLQIKNNLYQSGLFKKVLVKTSGNDLNLLVEERFTTIPILKFNSGGGVSSTTVGIFDPNVFGEALEFGGQYTRLDETNSGVLWHKNPFIGASSWGYQIQLWKTNRLREKFDPNKDRPVLSRGFLQTRDLFLTGLNYEWDQENTFSVTTEYHRDEFSTRLVPQLALGLTNTLPQNTKFFLTSISWKHDAFDYYSFYREGLGTEVKLTHATPLEEEAKAFQIFEWNTQYSRKISSNLQYASRLQLGITNTNTLQYWFYRGGLAGIRGYSDNRFAGRYLTLWNNELRTLLVERPTWIIQGAAFTDLISVNENFSNSDFLTAANAGLGFRLILPKIYRFVLRFDYAKPIIKEDDNEISFGVQQFF